MMEPNSSRFENTTISTKRCRLGRASNLGNNPMLSGLRGGSGKLVANAWRERERRANAATERGENSKKLATLTMAIMSNVVIYSR